MPEIATLEPPIAEPQRKPPHRFTKENAAAFARKSHAPESARHLHPQPASQIKPEHAQPASVDDRIAMLEEQIKLTRASLNDDDLEPKDRAQLIRGLCGLLDQLRIAKGEPLPGSRRPAADRGRARDETSAADWTAPRLAQHPAPAAPALPAKPLGWEYENQSGTVASCGVDTPTGSVQPPHP